MGGGGNSGGFSGRERHGWSLFDHLFDILGWSDEALVRVECLLAEPVGFFVSLPDAMPLEADGSLCRQPIEVYRESDTERVVSR